jgi:hypothetical protein
LPQLIYRIGGGGADNLLTDSGGYLIGGGGFTVCLCLLISHNLYYKYCVYHLLYLAVPRNADKYSRNKKFVKPPKSRKPLITQALQS